MMAKKIRLLVLLLLCCLATPAIAATQEKAPVVVPRIDTPVNIDGKLDEAAWRSALRLGLDYETDPGENIPALVKTDVYIMYDGANFYCALVCHDPDPSAIRARFNDRDANYRDDLINLNLDTFNDERRNYYFAVNPVGCQNDGIETPQGSDPSWDAIWDSAGVITEDGYIIEMAVPFSCLQFQRIEGPQIWGLDISRWYQRSVRHRLGLVPLDRNNNSYQGQFFKMQGFEAIEPGRNIELVPTLVASRSDRREALPDGAMNDGPLDGETGISVRWGVSNNFVLNGTINPDFSQVEADARQLDINRPFALYYQEKRPFFIEGVDYFRSPINAIYTRTIRDPSWGAKITGKEGDNTLGIYVARDEITNFIFPGTQGSSSASLRMNNDIGVVRYKRDFGTRTTIGALATIRRSDGYHNNVGGVDGEFRVDDRNKFSFQILGSSTQYPGELAAGFGQRADEFSDYALYADYEYRSRNLDYYIGYTDSGKEFRADLGFVPRVGYRELDTEFNARWINNQGWWNVVQVEGEYDNIEDQDGTLLFRSGRGEINFRGAMQSYAYLTVERNTESYIGQEYEITGWQGYAEFQPFSDLNLAGVYANGDQIDYTNGRLGEIRHADARGNYTYAQNLQLSAQYSHETLDVPEGNVYTANISQGTVMYHLDARTFVRLILQYVDYDYNPDTSTVPVEPNFKQLFTQFLFSYKINPQTVLFLGYSDDYFGASTFGLTQADRTFFMKIGYAWQM